MRPTFVNRLFIPLTALGLSLFVAGCGASSGVPAEEPSSTSTEPGHSASRSPSSVETLCQSATDDAGTVLFARGTTVQQVRERTGGPGNISPAADPWKSLNGFDEAAWCSIKSGSTYTWVAASASGEPVTFVTSDRPLGDPGPKGPAVP